MTQTDFDTKYSPIIMPEPFAESGDKTLPANTQDDDIQFDYPNGWGGSYSSPDSNKGKFVTRMQMNALGNLATHNDFYRRCGGINTFDPAFSEAIGGYPKGAVLDLVIDNQIYHVQSLIDNNKVDFRAGVDNINWTLLNYKEPSSIRRNVFFETGEISAESSFTIGSTTAKASSAIGIYEGLDILGGSGIVFSDRYNTEDPPGASNFMRYGSGIIIKDITDDPTVELPGITLPGSNVNSASIITNGWKSVAGDCGFIVWNNRADHAIPLLPLFEMSVTSGRKYAFAIWCGNRYSISPDDEYSAMTRFTITGLKLSGKLGLIYDV